MNQRKSSLLDCQISCPITSRIERPPSRAARIEFRIETGFSGAQVM